MNQSRRDLLKFFALSGGCFVAAASPVALVGCAKPGRGASQLSFPQGVASADPQADAVVIWTRVVGSASTVQLKAQVSLDPDFREVVLESVTSAEPSWDHTVRVLVTGLQSNRHYYYRFVADDGAASRVGRTRTAPAPGAETQLNVAVFSCQDYEQGYFTAYRRLLIDDADATPEKKIDFVMHVGDFFYETIRGPDTKGELDHNGREVKLFNRDGSPRRCGPFPSGGKVGSRQWMIPTNLEDYRWLYQKYLTDPDLQDARARFPFVQVWDDHELLNDYWQSYYKSKSIAPLKVASNQAWFEYIPAALSDGGRDGQPNSAQDFSPVEVTTAQAASFDDHYLGQEDNNLKAIGSMTIYRSLRWGGLAELFMIDGRSYRGPRGLPQELLSVGRHPYPEVPVDPALIRLLNEGRTANGGNPPREISYLGKTLPNPRVSAPQGSMLGQQQKAWLKKGLVESQAKWKLLGLNVGLMRHGFDDSFREGGHKNGLLWTDGWDGYPAERAELCTFIKDSTVTNVVSLTGDRHAHMAGLVWDDFDSESPLPVMPEFAGGAASAVSRMIIQRELSAHDQEVSQLVTFDGAARGYGQPIMPTLNAWMLFGAEAARAIHDGEQPAAAIRLEDKTVNPHLHYVDSDAHGYFVASITSDKCAVEYVSVLEPVVLPEAGSAPLRRRVSFEVTAWTDSPNLELKSTEGEPPFAGIRRT